VIYPDELANTLAPDRDEGAAMVSLAGYAARRRMKLRPFRRPRTLAVVAVQGPIVSKPGASLVPMAVEEELVAALRQVWDDPRALGALVVVNSQGGGAIASDRIRRAVERLAAKKPVVAYLANVAASGGYMIAVGAPHIVAQPTTLTGSIGVIAARFGMEKLLDRVGVRVEVVKRGDRADIGSPARPLTEGERGQLDRHLDETYRAFVAAVATGRKRQVEDVEPLAGGRVWSGRDAHARGLVDALGGLDVAVAELRARVGPRAKAAELRIVTPRRLRVPMLLGRVPSALGPGFAAAAELAQLSLSARDHAWAWCEARELEAACD
jgi:protease-4